MKYLLAILGITTTAMSPSSLIKSWKGLLESIMIIPLHRLICRGSTCEDDGVRVVICDAAGTTELSNMLGNINIIFIVVTIVFQ